MLKLFLEILRDQRAFDTGGATGGAMSGALAGSTFGLPGTIIGGIGGGILGGFSKKKKDEEIYDPYAAQRGQYANYLSGKLGTSTPYAENPAFNIQQPAVESAAENVITGRLGNLPTAEDYKGKVETAKSQDILREKESAADQLKQEQDMYNRLGLASSSPWLGRAGELGEESLMRQGDISSGYDIFGLNYGLESEKAMSDIGAQWSGLGSALGGQQAGYQKFSKTASLQDLERQINEEMGYSNQMAGLLGQIGPERTVSNTPNTAAQLMSILQNKDFSTLLRSFKQ